MATARLVEQCCTLKWLLCSYAWDVLAVEHRLMGLSAITMLTLLAGHAADVPEYAVDPEMPV